MISVSRSRPKKSSSRSESVERRQALVRATRSARRVGAHVDRLREPRLATRRA